MFFLELQDKVYGKQIYQNLFFLYFVQNHQMLQTMLLDNILMHKAHQVQHVGDLLVSRNL